MPFEQLRDFASDANREVGDYRLQFILSPKKMRRGGYDIEQLDWTSIHFGNDDELETIPDDKRGVYALIVCHPNQVLSPHGYVIYIGIAGRRSNRSLRARYRDYLNERRLLKERPGLAHAIGNWQDVLRFYFAPIDDGFPAGDLERLEQQINSALMPPYSIGDLEADTKRKKKAFP